MILRDVADLTPSQLARTLLSTAQHIRLSRYAKNRWRHKKKRNHISTARILEKRKQASKAMQCWLQEAGASP